MNATDYAVAVSRSVTGTDGNPIGEPTAFFYAMSPEPLVEWRFFDTEAHIYGEHVVPVEGKLDVPQGAGLGYDPDPAVIDRYRVS